MKNLIKCHLNYLISKTTIIVTAIVLLIIMIGSISSIFALESNLGYNDNNYIYFNNVFIISKILIIIYSIFLFGYSNLTKTDQYAVVLIASGISRIKIIVSKIIAICLIVLIVCYFAYFQYILIGFINFREFLFKSVYLNSFIVLYLLACFFGLFSLQLIQKFDNIYTIIIPFALMNLSEMSGDDVSIVFKIIYFVIPYYTNKLNFYYGSIHAIILIIILLVINIYYYNIKDIKTNL